MIKNALILCLAAALALSLIGYYKRGKDIENICKLLGPHDDLILAPKNPIEQVGNICVAWQDEG